ncbi:hypothetical protein BJ875DRAFT_475830 [Amylocarpus encephaloides]|uniref:DUF8021 domain-containing protein n=1 Tax=Amylocarpus encephaloides TaxID=45428 RepID=A0A9P7Y9U3_9HELO|nr:hypothetical protein BJ875DRAFT_475830 [Amylocarpus encephaloides]
MIPSILLLSLAAIVSADCPRSFLKNLTETYVRAQAVGDYDTFLSIINPTSGYRENGFLVSIPDSMPAIPVHIDFTRSVHDTVQCATFTEIIAATDPHPYVIHTRMEFSPGDPQARLIESVITDKGDWYFNAKGTLALNARESWEAIPKEKQESREVIRGVADSYFDRFGNASVVVPWGAPCYRVEGGFAVNGNLTASGDCIQEFPDSIYFPYRRYVIDQEYGAVDVFVGFPGLDSTEADKPMPDSHLFRVEGAKIKYVHTNSACVSDGCGNATMPQPT